MPPNVDKEIHADILEFMIEWCPIGNPLVVGHGDRYFTNEIKFTMQGLIPATGHGFMVYSRSLAGWSQPSAKIISFTLPTRPDPPPPVEVLKITTNGLMLGWNPPQRDNGATVDLFELEVIDYASHVKQLEEIEEKKMKARIARRKSKGKRGSTDQPEIESLTGDDSIDLDNNGNEDDIFDEDDFDEDDNLNLNDSEVDISPQNLSVASSESNENDSSVAKVNASKTLAIEQTMGLWHRLVKIRDTKRRHKQLVGLEPHCPYMARVKCHNSCGYSSWSDWCGPISPQPGVYVLEFHKARGKVRLAWFKPILSSPRKVTAYEAQLRNVVGPMIKKINVYPNHQQKISTATGVDNEADKVGDSGGMGFFTLRDDLTTNELEISDLQPGGKYMCRVRAQIDGIWNSWEICVISDIISMPASVPDAPFDVHPASVDVEKDSEDAKDGGISTDKKILLAPVLDIQHDSILIKWKNGFTNGFPAMEYEVNIAKVREYRSNDLILAHNAAAAKGTQEIDGKKVALPVDEKYKVVISTESVPGVDAVEYIHDGLINELPWVSLTGAAKEKNGSSGSGPTGELLGAQAFRARGLDPGSSYVFRVRQRNDLGWSDYSSASSLITTFPSVPPGRPFCISFFPFHVILRWEESADMRLALTNLEYDVQIGKLPLIHINDFLGGRDAEDANIGGRDGDERREWESSINSIVSWEKADTRIWDNNDIDIDKMVALIPLYGSSPLPPANGTVTVLVDRLSPGTPYVARVRVRTVAGWSTWSQIGDIFSTLSAP